MNEEIKKIQDGFESLLKDIRPNFQSLIAFLGSEIMFTISKCKVSQNEFDKMIELMKSQYVRFKNEDFKREENDDSSSASRK